MATPPSDRALTRNQTMVLDCLRRAGRPLTAYQVLDRLREEGVAAPPTVYRALDKLLTLAYAHRLESLNAYVACCAHGHSAEMAFAICKACGDVKELEAGPALAHLALKAEEQGFSVRKTHVELIGLCAECRRTA